MDRINYMEPSFDEAEKNAVNAYMDSGGWLTEFIKTREFEEAIRAYVGAAHCSVMSNGTVTLMAGLMACGVGPGDEVVVPDFTMSATSHVVEMIGARAVFVDVERDTLCMDYEQMVQAVSRKTKAVIVVDLNGRYPGRMEEIVSFCKERRIFLIEDAAQALGSSMHGRALGTFGDIGSYSFSMPKIITTGQGGAIVTDSDLLYERILKIRDFGRAETGSDHYVAVGCNFKFTDIQAVIGIEQMKKLRRRVDRKKQMARLYEKGLDGIDGIRFIKSDYADSAPCFMEVLVSEPDEKEQLQEYLKENGINTRSFYPPLHGEPVYGYNHLHYPVTEEISRAGFWLPSGVELTDEQIGYICGTVRRYYNMNTGDKLGGVLNRV